MSAEACAAQAELQPEEEISSDVDEPNHGYKIPEKATAQEMLTKDQDDDALVNYKKQLLPGAEHVTGEPVKVTLKKLTLFSLADDMKREVDLTDIQTKTLPTIKLKEGINYKIEFQFIVENDIVTGLKYHHVVKRKGVKLDKEMHMLGSFGPDPNKLITLTTSDSDMPSGMLARGHYVVTSQFIDDDKNVHLKWEWAFDLSKGWE